MRVANGPVGHDFVALSSTEVAHDGFVVAHDDRGIPAVDEAAPGRIGYSFNVHVHGVPQFGASKIDRCRLHHIM